MAMLTKSFVDFIINLVLNVRSSVEFWAALGVGFVSSIKHVSVLLKERLSFLTD